MGLGYAGWATAIAMVLGCGSSNARIRASMIVACVVVGTGYAALTLCRDMVPTTYAWGDRSGEGAIAPSGRAAVRGRVVPAREDGTVRGVVVTPVGE